MSPRTLSKMSVISQDSFLLFQGFQAGILARPVEYQLGKLVGTLLSGAVALRSPALDFVFLGYYLEKGSIWVGLFLSFHCALVLNMFY